MPAAFGPAFVSSQVTHESHGVTPPAQFTVVPLSLTNSFSTFLVNGLTTTVVVPPPPRMSYDRFAASAVFAKPGRRELASARTSTSSSTPASRSVSRKRFTVADS